MDDPRDILKAAGVECAEVDTFLCGRGPSEWEDDDELDAAFLALARLVIKFKWQRDEACEFVAGYANRVVPHAPPLTGADVLADIERDYKARK